MDLNITELLLEITQVFLIMIIVGYLRVHRFPCKVSFR